MEGMPTKALEDLNRERAENRRRLKLFFDGIDEDGNGSISKRELISALRNIRGVAECLDLPQVVRPEGGTRAAFESFFQNCDSDRDGEISWEEFLRAGKVIQEFQGPFARKVRTAMEYNPYHAARQHLQNCQATVATRGAKVSFYSWHRHTVDINLISLDVRKLRENRRDGSGWQRQLVSSYLAPAQRT
jgi:hypothetical protein